MQNIIQCQCGMFDRGVVRIDSEAHRKGFHVKRRKDVKSSRIFRKEARVSAWECYIWANRQENRVVGFRQSNEGIFAEFERLEYTSC